MTALRWINGLTLTLAFSLWLALAALQLLFNFSKGAAKTFWNTGVLFASGFQKNPRNEAPEGLSWLMLATGVVLLALWSSIFTPSLRWWLHGCAAAAAGLLVWTLWQLRFQGFGPWIAGILALWFAYYWVAALRYP